MSTKVIFLDIDGVCNDHTFNSQANSTTIKASCVNNLNKILTETDSQIVLSTAWRYMILNGAMTLKGFEYLLRTHGVYAENRLLGLTREDRLLPNDPNNKRERGVEIQDWLKEHPEVEKYVVVDDLDLGISKLHPFVQTNKNTGLTEEETLKAINLLNT